MRTSEMEAEAGKSQAEADELKDEAIDLKAESTRRIYNTDMNRVQQMVEGGNKTGGQEVLEKYLPGSGKSDLRRIRMELLVASLQCKLSRRTGL